MGVRGVPPEKKPNKVYLHTSNKHHFSDKSKTKGVRGGATPIQFRLNDTNLIKGGCGGLLPKKCPITNAKTGIFGVRILGRGGYGQSSCGILPKILHDSFE